MSGRSVSILFVASVSLALAVRASSQTQTTGRITGTVKDTQGAMIAGAEVSIENPATGDRHSAVTDSSGTYSILRRREAQRSNNLESKDKCIAMLGVNFQFQAGAQMLGCRGLGRLTLRPTCAEESPRLVAPLRPAPSTLIQLSSLIRAANSIRADPHLTPTPLAQVPLLFGRRAHQRP
jgi:Carboxypeptidase regulatory-like domain